jgi:hypothetical protein
MEPLDRSISLRDQIRLTLEEYGDRDIPYAVEDIAEKIGQANAVVYQALYGMARTGEIELLKESDGTTRSRIVGIRLNKLASSSDILAKSAEKAASKEIKKQVTFMSRLVNLSEYIRRKSAIEEARELLRKNDLDPNQVLFDEDPIGEEAIWLAENLQSAISELTSLRYDLEAAQRDVAYLKEKHKENSRTELIEIANA